MATATERRLRRRDQHRYIDESEASSRFRVDQGIGGIPEDLHDLVDECVDALLGRAVRSSHLGGEGSLVRDDPAADVLQDESRVRSGCRQLCSPGYGGGCRDRAVDIAAVLEQAGVSTTVLRGAVPQPEGRGVRIGTMHRMKGLEHRCIAVGRDV